MGLLRPTPPPYDALAWRATPFAERSRMVCEAWAMQGYGTPAGVFALYAAKVALYVAGWVFFCGFSPALGAPSAIASWWLHPLAFQKAIVWSMLFEVLGGRTRGMLDVILYLGLIVASLRMLIAPVPGFQHFLALAIVLPLLGMSDKTIFLAARSEHYWVTIVCFAFAQNWIAGAKAVQAALWFWAGFSKLNHHFPTVVCVMRYYAGNWGTGPLETGEVSVDDLCARQPWTAAA